MLALIAGDIDPAKHAGESWFATEEYFPQDIKDPHVRADTILYGDYYPTPAQAEGYLRGRK